MAVGRALSRSAESWPRWLLDQEYMLGGREKDGNTGGGGGSFRGIVSLTLTRNPMDRRSDSQSASLMVTLTHPAEAGKAGTLFEPCMANPSLKYQGRYKAPRPA